ncbi:unnamed protein product, partial [Prorocentrum cordatum]
PSVATSPLRLSGAPRSCPGRAPPAGSQRPMAPTSSPTRGAQQPGAPPGSLWAWPSGARGRPSPAPRGRWPVHVFQAQSRAAGALLPLALAALAALLLGQAFTAPAAARAAPPAGAEGAPLARGPGAEARQLQSGRGAAAAEDEEEDDGTRPIVGVPAAVLWFGTIVTLFAVFSTTIMGSYSSTPFEKKPIVVKNKAPAAAVAVPSAVAPEPAP